MLPEYEFTELRGHRYDIRAIGASIEWFALIRDTERAKAAGRDASLPFALAEEARQIVRAQGHDIHEASRAHEGYVSCSCGLVVPDGVALAQATGHLDQRFWEPVDVILVAHPPAPTLFGDASHAVAYCQRCGWISSVLEPPAARRAAAAHRD